MVAEAVAVGEGDAREEDGVGDDDDGGGGGALAPSFLLVANFSSPCSQMMVSERRYRRSASSPPLLISWTVLSGREPISGARRENIQPGSLASFSEIYFLLFFLEEE